MEAKQLGETCSAAPGVSLVEGTEPAVSVTVAPMINMNNYYTWC